jgi:hypothetical protein
MKSSNMIKPYNININQLRREFSSTNSVTEDKKTERQNEEKINQNETKIFEKKNKLFNFDINLVRNNYYKKPNESKYENEFSSTNSVTEDKRTEKENEQNKINSNEVTTISNEKLMNISNYTEEQIPIDYIKNNFEDFKENLSTNDKTEKSVNKNPTKPTYYIPFRKIFKEDNKKIDIDELQFNDNKKKEENKILNKEKSNFNTNFIKPDFSGDNKNEYNSQNFLNMQNNSNNVWGYFKIIEEEKKFNQLLQIGLISLLNDGNLNNYLLPLFINNSINSGINNFNGFLNYNQFNPFNNNMNCYGNNIYGNCFQNNNIINSLQHQQNINSFNNINNPEKYTITLKSKTNDPSIEKIAKIQVTTSFVKDNSKAKQEKTDNSMNLNTKNVINLNDIINGKEKRTVVRLNPIPPNYSSFDVCKLLDMHLKIESGKNQRIYKALYTPLCKVIGKNLGYCFVMMVKPKYVIDFYNVFNGRIFGKKKCKKPCKVIWADIQGEEFIKDNEEDPIRKPIIFKDIIIDKDDK